MIFEQLTVGTLQTNCYLLGEETHRQAILIDPGAEGQRICGRIRDLGLELSAILITHAHFDHVMAAWTLKEQLGGRLFLNAQDQPSLLQVIFGLAMRFPPEIRPVAPGQVDRWIADGDLLEFGSAGIKVLETPGHTPGHVSFYLSEPGILFSGDVIFAGSIGRTDFMGGSLQQLITSVRNKIFPLPDDTLIYPGHGVRTTVGRERRHNPFFK
ncbi:MAG: MBL fold metallo-hydrolase [Syntrophobacteraceae bacterium]